MKKLKSMPGILAVSAMALTANAYDAKMLTVQNVAGGSGGPVTNQVLYVGNQSNVTIQWLSSATNIVARFGTSVDGSNFTTNTFVITFDTSTTPGRAAVTNLNVGGLGYLRLDHYSVGGSIAATNTIRYSNKPGI
ncbi:MAG TPA: hypothetical protein VEH04_08125 [Verrucomicrobiae bacterium]|nr:hypothetical protein [Verrucomicrobiae bacterium]